MSSTKNAPEIKNGSQNRPEVSTLTANSYSSTSLSPSGDRSIITKLKKSGLDAQKLLELAIPASSNVSRRKSRHIFILFSFLILVVLPTIFSSAYLLFWASDQFHSTAAFAVRSANKTAATEILGMVLSGSSESTTSDSYIINDYLQSQAIIEDIGNAVDLESIFNRQGADWYFRMGSKLPIEDQLNYWNSMVDVSYDGTSGVIYVEVRSFDPNDSALLAQEILKRSEILVNQLSDANRRQTVRFAEETLARAEVRLGTIRRRMQTYRDNTQEVNPEDNVAIAMQMVGELELQMIEKQSELEILSTYLDVNALKVRLLKKEISVIRAQMEKARNRLGDSSFEGSKNDERLSVRIANYSDLKLEEQFANQFYGTALASLEKARQDADQKSIYLATFIDPTTSEAAQYPNRFLYSISIFLLLLGFWLVSVLLYYNIRDRT